MISYRQNLMTDPRMKAYRTHVHKQLNTSEAYLFDELRDARATFYYGYKIAQHVKHSLRVDVYTKLSWLMNGEPEVTFREVKDFLLREKFHFVDHGPDPELPDVSALLNKLWVELIDEVREFEDKEIE